MKGYSPNVYRTVSLRTKILYGVGALSDSIKTLSFSMFLLFYYTTVLGLPGRWLALAMALGLIWDAVVDPVVGHWSDQISIRYGRRHFFMFLGAIIAGISFVAVFNPPNNLSHEMLLMWLVATSMCLRSGNSLYTVAYYALGSELTDDYHERTVISCWRVGIIILGTLCAIGMAFYVFLPSESHLNVDAKYSQDGYAAMGITFGAAILVFGLIATFGTFEYRFGRRSNSPSQGGTQRLLVHLMDATKDRQFMLLVASNSLVAMATAINAALCLHYLTYYAVVDKTAGFAFYMGGLYVGAIIGVLLWVRVARRVEKSVIYAHTTVVTAIVLASLYWLVGEGNPLGTGNVGALVAISVMAGIFGSTAPIFVPSMIADLAARAQDFSPRSDGVYFGIYSMGQQVFAGVAFLCSGLLVDFFAGLVPAQAEQSDQTIERIAIIYSQIPAVLLVIAGLIALYYKRVANNDEDSASSKIVSKPRLTHSA